MVGRPIIRNWRMAAIPQDRHMLTLLQVIWYWESFLKHKQAGEIGWLPSNRLSPQFYRPLFPFQPIQPQISISGERGRGREKLKERDGRKKTERKNEGEEGAEMEASEVSCVGKFRKFCGGGGGQQKQRCEGSINPPS